LPPAIFTNQEWSSLVEACGLSPRQAEIVGLVMQSWSCCDIIAALDISPSTYRTQLDRAKVRLGACDRVGLVYQMFRNFKQMNDGNNQHPSDGEPV
jgi:DNA-binding CsgD family transcriptional regulator